MCVLVITLKYINMWFQNLVICLNCICSSKDTAISVKSPKMQNSVWWWVLNLDGIPVFLFLVCLNLALNLVLYCAAFKGQDSANKNYAFSNIDQIRNLVWERILTDFLNKFGSNWEPCHSSRSKTQLGK